MWGHCGQTKGTLQLSAAHFLPRVCPTSCHILGPLPATSLAHFLPAVMSTSYAQGGGRCACSHMGLQWPGPCADPCADPPGPCAPWASSLGEEVALHFFAQQMGFPPRSFLPDKEKHHGHREPRPLPRSSCEHGASWGNEAGHPPQSLPPSQAPDSCGRCLWEPRGGGQVRGASARGRSGHHAGLPRGPAWCGGRGARVCARRLELAAGRGRLLRTIRHAALSPTESPPQNLAIQKPTGPCPPPA